MGLKPLDAYPSGGVDSRSNPINMPRDRYLMVRNLWPQQDGGFRLRDGYSLLVPGLQPGVPIHSIVGVTGPGPTYKPLVVFWQGKTPYIFDPSTITVSASTVRGTQIQSSNRFCYFYTDGHLHAFNGTDAKWFDGLTWRDIGLPQPNLAAAAQLSVTGSVREFSSAEQLAVTLTLAAGGSFPADVVGRTFFCAYYDLDAQEIGPATIPIGSLVSGSGFVKFALNNELQVTGLPNISAAEPRWVKLPGLTGDGDNRGKFCATSSTSLSGGTTVVQSFALSATSVSNDPGHFGTPSFSVALSAGSLAGGPVTATVSGTEQSVPDASIPLSSVIAFGGSQQFVFFHGLIYNVTEISIRIIGSNDFDQTFVTAAGGSAASGTVLASQMASTINATSNGILLASASGGNLTITPTGLGAGAAYTIANITATTLIPAFFTGPSFNASITSGAIFGQRTVFDTGHVSVTVNTLTAVANYANGDTAPSVAQKLEAAINGLVNSGISATVLGAVVTISRSVSGIQTTLTATAHGLSIDDVVGLSNTGDSAYDGHLFTVIAVPDANHFTINVPGAVAPPVSGTVQRILKVAPAATTCTITAPNFFVPFWVNEIRGIAATGVGGVQPGYQFYISLYMKTAGGHVGNRVAVGQRFAPAVRTNVRILGTIPVTDSEQQILIGRTADGAEIPYVIIDNTGTWLSTPASVQNVLIEDSNTDGSSEMPSRSFPPPGTLDYNQQLANLPGGVIENPPVITTFKRAWVESDHCCGTIDGLPTIYRSGSAQDLREGVFVGLPEQAYDPVDIETFPTANPITCGQGYEGESWVFTRQDSGVLLELAGETQWQGPWNIGGAGQFAWAKAWKNMPFWVTGTKQLATISLGGYEQTAGMSSVAKAGPVVVSQEYEAALLAKIGDAYLGDTEVCYIRHPDKLVDVLRIKCRDSNGCPFTVIHDFNLRDERSPYGQAYEENLTGSLTSNCDVAGGDVTPPPVLEDLLNWVMISFPERTTEHLSGPGAYAANWLDADGLKFWLIKNLLGNPWDINTYDANGIYHYITENADTGEPGGSHWGSNNAFKRALVPLKVMPRNYDPTAGPVTIITPGPNQFVRTLSCESDGEPLKNLGTITAVTSGGLGTMDWGGDVGIKPTLINTIYFGTEREQFFYVKGMGLIQWQHANLTSGAPVTGVYVVDQTTLHNMITPGGCPTPNFPCWVDIPGAGFSGSWIGGAPGAGGNVAGP